MRDRGHLAAVAGLAGVALCAGLQPYLWASVGGLLDYYPLYYGALAWLETGDAYWRDPSLADIGQLSNVGNAYPIHAVLLLGMPLAWLPPTLAGVLWVMAIGVAWIASIAWSKQSWYWLLWWPMWDALRIQQASAAVTVASIAALGALQRDSRMVYLAAIPVVAVKPQQTFLLLLMYVWWGRRWWKSMLAVWGGLLGWAFIAQPEWLWRWYQSAVVRAEVLDGERWLVLLLLPLGALLMVRGWHTSGIAVASSGFAPWPVAGPYVASIWPLGLDKRRHAGLVLIGLAALVALLMDSSYWAFTGILVGGIAVLALAQPHAPARERTSESREVVGPR